MKLKNQISILILQYHYTVHYNIRYLNAISDREYKT